MNFAVTLTFLLVVLKLTGCIDWSWVFVLLPLYAGFVLGVLIFVIVGSVLSGMKRFNLKLGV